MLGRGLGVSGEVFQGSIHSQASGLKSALSASDTEWAALFIGVLVPIVFQVPTNLYCNLFKATFLIPCPPLP